MIRTLKALGLGLMATLALSVVAVASASAQNAHTRVADNSGVIKMTEHPNSTLGGIQFFETTSGMIECHEFDGEINYSGGSGGSTNITSETIENVEYDECFLGGLEAEVDFGTCDYTVSNPEWVNPPGHARSDVELGPGGCEVTITDLVIGCEVTVPGGQQFENALTSTNVNTGLEEETTHVGTGNIEYSAGALCPDPGSQEGGVYEGTITAKGFNSPATAQVHLTSIATP